MKKQEDSDVENIKLYFEVLREFWQRLLRQGVLVTAQFVAIGSLSYALCWTYRHNEEQRDAMTREFRHDIADARRENRECEQERIRQAAVFKEEINALRAEIFRQYSAKR